MPLLRLAGPALLPEGAVNRSTVQPDVRKMRGDSVWCQFRCQLETEKDGIRSKLAESD